MESVVFGGGWKFNSKRGAILLMHKAHPTRVPDAFFTAASLHLPALKNMYVVYEAWNCFGYYMYLSNRCAYSYPLVFPEKYISVLPTSE